MERFNSLEEILYKYDNITGRWVYETNEDKVRECLEEFNQIITNILTGKESITKAIQTDRPVEKAGKKMSGKNKETLAGIYESLGAFLKEFDDPEDDPDKKDDGDDKGDDKSKKDKEEKEVTKQEVEEIVAKSIATAIEKAGCSTGGGDKPKEDEKDKEVKKSEEVITPESIDAMVQAAIAKAMEPQEQEQHVSAEQVQDMITKAVAAAVDPVLKSKGLPSNLNGSSTVEKSAEHYLHGIL